MTVGPTTRFHEDCYAIDMTTFYWQHKFPDCDIWDQQMRENYTQNYVTFHNYTNETNMAITLNKVPAMNSKINGKSN